MTDLEDPLEGLSGLSLFQRASGSLPKPPFDPPDDDLVSNHNLLKSLPVKHFDELIEQAKRMLDTNSEPVDASTPNDIMPEDKNDVVFREDVESPRARRLGLGRKRARFSLLPNSSKPTELNIDNLQDPEKFFSAFQRLEDAKREMAKQTGSVSVASNHSSISMAPRPRRPGIPGRSRAVRYQHLYPTMYSEETFEENILSPCNPGSPQETVNLSVASQLTESANVASEDSELAGSTSNTEKRIDKLLDELLARDYEELDGDGAVNLIQDGLQIKSLDLEKLNLPELLEVRGTNLKASGRNSLKPMNVLSDIQNLTGRSRTPNKQQNAERSATSFDSLMPKSPLASLSLLRKRILQSNPQTGPFSAIDIDRSPATNVSSFENINNSSYPFNRENDKSLLKPLRIDNGPTTGNISPARMAIDGVGSPSDKSPHDNLTSPDSGSDSCPSKSNAQVENNVTVDNGVGDENLSQPGVDADVQADGVKEVEDMMEDIQQKVADSGEPHDTPVEILNDTQDQFEASSPADVEDRAMDDCLQSYALAQTKDNTLDHSKERAEEPPMESTKKQAEANSRPSKPSKNRSLSKRQSLAASGTSWETGVRRSTRIRSRPLEYWKGERFLYGRIHGSLATVIGIKYESPGKNKGKPAALKVKSFVSDEYKDMVELAALH